MALNLVRPPPNKRSFLFAPVRPRTDTRTRACQALEFIRNCSRPLGWYGVASGGKRSYFWVDDGLGM